MTNLSIMNNSIKIVLYTLCLSTIHTNGDPLQGEQVEPAVENEFPFLVSLGEAPATDIRNHFCGGTLISKRHVLTSSHCFINAATGLPFLDATSIVVTIGSNDVTLGRKIPVKSWTTYLDWAGERNIRVTLSLFHDLSVATLAEDVTDIAPASISQCKHRQIRGQDAVTAGWGLINGDYLYRILQKAKLQVIARSKCRFNFVQTNWTAASVVNHLCTTNNPMVALGCGDSGGPLLINGNELIGVNESVCVNNITHPNEQNSHQSVEYYRKFIEAFAERKAPCTVGC